MIINLSELDSEHRLTESHSALLSISIIYFPYAFKVSENIKRCFLFDCYHQGLQKTCKMFRFPTVLEQVL